MADDHLDSDIAIIGMAAHLPGARTTDEFWDNLVGGVESIERFSDEELLASGVSRALLRHPRYVKASGVLLDMELFDGDFFGFSPKECAILDPQHRHFTECCWEALEDAGHPPDRFGAPIGVFGGCGMGSYFYFNLCTNPDLVDSVGMFLLRHTGNDKDFLVTRVAHVLNLEGPAINVQTACSTSLVAVHCAAQSLLSQECDMALAGGVTIEIPHRRGYMFEPGAVLSPDGHCRAFDHRSQGTVFGSGAGVVVLRRLADAIADGDHIYAVLKSTAVNNDGASKAGFLAPSVQGQANCIVEAHALADLNADAIGYVECHGTGTYLGDPIEIGALTEAFRQSTDEQGFCRIGSVKTNIGHLDTAAGIVSLIKTALILEREQIPATLNYQRPNPALDLESSPFVVNDTLTAWPRADQPRRAGVQSLGVGGTNAHVIVEEAPLSPETDPTLGLQLLTLSAKNRKALAGNAAKLAAHLRAHPEQKLADVAWTLQVGRSVMERRRIAVASDHQTAASILSDEQPRRVFAHKALNNPEIAFLFPGGGAQYAGMARGLYEAQPVFRRIMDRAFATLAADNLAGAFDLKRLLWEGDEDDLLPLPVQLPAIFSISYALSALLEEWGVVPAVLLGHSMGEYVAACLAGVFTFEEALRLVLLRGHLISTMPEGAMLAVPMDAPELRPILGPDVDLAGAHGPGLSLVSGEVAAIDAFERRLSARGVEARRIDIDRAAHSRMLDPILPAFEEHLRSMTLRKPERKYVSSRTGEWIRDEQATDPAYWVDHLRHTVEFSKAVELVAARGPTIFVEVGPGKALGSFAKAHAGVDGQAVLSTLRHRDEEISDDAFFLEVVGRLWALGAEIPLERLFRGQQRKRVRLPTYAFQRLHYFIEPGVGAGASAQTAERFETVRDFGYVPQWRPKAADAAVDADTASWLIFMDDEGIGERVVQALRKKGRPVTRVYPGDAFAKRAEGEYVLSPEHGREGYDTLMQELLKAGRLPTRILHLWLITGDESHRAGSSFFHRNQERGFYSLFFLVSALADENVPRPIDLTVITNGMQAVGDERVRYPEKATSLGPIRVAPREMPGLTTGTLDVVLPKSRSRLFDGRLVNALVDSFWRPKNLHGDAQRYRRRGAGRSTGRAPR